MGHKPTHLEALRAAVSRLGGQSAAARALGVSQSAVCKWLNVTRQVPPIYVLRIERMTGVSRHWLRPDIYPVEDDDSSGTWTGLDEREHVVTYANGGVSKRNINGTRAIGGAR